MGCTICAYTIIGVKIHKSELERRAISPVRGCHHPKTDKKFCAECGAPTWEDKEDILDIDIEAVIEPFSERMSYLWGEESEYVYVGYCLESGEYDREHQTPVPNIEDLKTALAQALGPLNLWNGEIQVHNLLYMSA